MDWLIDEVLQYIFVKNKGYPNFVVMLEPLWTGTKPSNEEPAGSYPTVVERADGSKGLVVQAYAYSKYLGHISVDFDEQGRVQDWSGNPILLNSSVEQG